VLLFILPALALPFVEYVGESPLNRVAEILRRPELHLNPRLHSGSLIHLDGFINLAAQLIFSWGFRWCSAICDY